MVPLAVRPTPPRHIDFNDYYVSRYDIDRFADKALWRDAIFAHLEKEPELRMLRLWQCVEANRDGRTAQSLEDIVEPRPTPIWQTLFDIAGWFIVLLACCLTVVRLLVLSRLLSYDWWIYTWPRSALSPRL